MAGIFTIEADAILPWPPLPPGDTSGPVTEGIRPPTHWDPATMAAPSPPTKSWTLEEVALNRGVDLSTPDGVTDAFEEAGRKAKAGLLDELRIPHRPEPYVLLGVIKFTEAADFSIVGVPSGSERPRIVYRDPTPSEVDDPSRVGDHIFRFTRCLRFKVQGILV